MHRSGDVIRREKRVATKMEMKTKTYVRSQQMGENRWRKFDGFAILVLSSLLLSVITF